MTMFDRLGLGVLTLIVAGVHLSCFDARPSNPLDQGVSLLLIPTVQHPVGGEQLFPGTLMDIRWLPAAGGIDSTVTLQLISDVDTTLIATSVVNLGSYSWSIPNRPGLSYRVRISGKGGASESPGPFRIKPTPVVQRLNIGSREGRSPAALYHLVVFESSSNLWLLDRIKQSVSQITSNARGAYGASWLKPRGKIFAYNAVNSLNTGSDIWIHVIEGLYEGDYQITQDGGVLPTWQISDAFVNPSLAYLKVTSLPESGILRQILAVTLDTPGIALPSIQTPLRLQGPPVEIARSSEFGLNFKSLAWTYTNDRNEVLYVTNNGQSRVSRLIFPAQNFDDISVGAFALSPDVSPDEISYSPNGRYIAFGSNGQIWVSSVNGLGATPVTHGSTTDTAPDWATDQEIVFQRQNAGRAWELWSVFLGDPP